MREKGKEKKDKNAKDQNLPFLLLSMKLLKWSSQSNQRIICSINGEVKSKILQKGKIENCKKQTAHWEAAFARKFTKKKVFGEK